MVGRTNPAGRVRPRRSQLPDEVASYVRELIMSGSVRPGEFLRLEPIAEAVGVSNTPVREGLLALRSEGLVQLLPRRGFVVAPFAAQDIRDLFWTQAKLGGELAARAATRLTSEQLDWLAENCELIAKAMAAGDRERAAELGHKFHREINLGADSLRLALLLGSVIKHLPNRFYATIGRGVENSLVDHPKLVAALRARDAEKSRAIMERHILDGADSLIASLTREGVWGEPTPLRMTKEKAGSKSGLR